MRTGISSVPAPRRATVLASLLVVAVIAFTVGCGGGGSDAAATRPSTTTISTQAGTAQLPSGAELFRDNCQSCHGLINPLGFTLENFDAVGRYRDRESGKPVDATGTYLTRTGDPVTFHGARDLAESLAKTDEVQAAFADRLFHHLAQQPVQAYGPGALEKLRGAFAASGFNVRKLAVEIAVTAALPPEKKKSKPAG